VASFLETYLADLRAGSVAPLEVYQARYPGFEEVIAEEYAALTRRDDDGAADPHLGSDPPAIGHYRLLRRLGRGGQGDVHLAEDQKLGRPVALKVLRHFSSVSRERVARFRREGELASRLDHPGLATVHDVGFEDGVPYIAMRYVEGETLAEQIASAGDRVASGDASRTSSTSTSRAEVHRIVEVVEQAARAVHVAHEAGIIHRDLKPGNIMVTPDGRAVVLDFGLAHELEGDQPITQSGDLFGTPHYMSPEQLTAHRVRLDRRTDVYSLAVTLYEALTRRRPFDGATREAIYQAILGKEPPDPHRFNPAIPRDLRVVLDTALEKDRDRRYQTTRDLADELERVRRRLPIRARKVSAPRRFGRWVRREPARAAVLALVLVIAAGAGYWASAWPAIHAQQRIAEEVKRSERLHRALQEAHFELQEGGPERALAAYRHASDIDPESVLAMAGVAMALHEIGRHQEVLSTLEAHSGLVARHRSLVLLRERALNALGRHAEAERLEVRGFEPRSHFDCYLAAQLELSRGHQGDRTAFGRAADWMRRCILLAPRPQVLYHLELAHALGHTDDNPARLRIAEVVERRYGDHASPFPWYWAGFARLGIDPEGAIRAFREAVMRRERFTAAWINLGESYLEIGDAQAALGAARRALDQKPDRRSTARARFTMGSALAQAGDTAGASTAFEEAIRLDGKLVLARVQLGRVLLKDGKLARAEAVFREARALRPDLIEALTGLGEALDKQGRSRDAVSVLREAIGLAPDHAESHLLLGIALQNLGDRPGAVEAFRTAVRLRPDHALSTMHLARALWSAGKQAEAVVAIRKVLDLEPENARAWADLGDFLRCQGKVADAARAFRRATRLDADLADAWFGLALALASPENRAAAIEACERGLRLRPERDYGHYVMGIVRERIGDDEGAVEAYRATLRLNPENARALCNLGGVFASLGRFEEAVRAYRKGHKIGSALENWSYPSEQWLREAERLAALDPRLEAVLRGDEDLQGTKDGAALAGVANRKKQFAAAARLWMEVLALDPPLQESLRGKYRQWAARAAIFAGTGQGRDARDLDEATRERWRTQAVRWLREDLEAWLDLHRQGKVRSVSLRTLLGRWKTDRELAPIREPERLAGRAESERDLCRRFWSQVDAFLARTADE